jgi:predicted dehydrogenase
MKQQQSINRREVLKLAAAASMPVFLPGRLFGAKAPSNKITIGCIGIGWQGGTNMKNFLGNPDCRVVAVADVDQNHLKEAAEMVNKQYSNQDCKMYKDFRELLARKDIDAVCIATPDHWHSITAVMAANAKKDIFCEKPLSHTLAEGIAMVKAAQKNKRIWQTGSWQRSNLNFRWAAGLVCNGFIGKIKRVEVGLPAGHSDFEKTGKDKPNSDPPREVDYDFWIGPAQMVPFNPCRFHKNWLWSYNTGGGQLMDWIGHHCDIGHWGLSNAKFGCGPDDRIGPLEVSATAEFPPKDAVWNTATKFRVECRYPNSIEVVIAGPPSLLMEILSPSTEEQDRIRKQRLYARFGIKEYWLVTPFPSMIEILALDEGRATFRIAESFSRGEIAASALFPDFHVAMDEIFSFPLTEDERRSLERLSPTTGTRNGEQRRRAVDN